MKLELIAFKEFSNYPSGSGIEFYNGIIYLVGDDAKNILLMTRKWKHAERINLFDTVEKRISKKVKSDLEATTLVFINNKPYLLILGSGSKVARNKAILLNLKTKEKKFLDITVFYDRLKSSGIAELNIEGAALVNDYLVLCNRGNKTNPHNSLIVTHNNFWSSQQNVRFTIVQIELPNTGEPMGISGITYSHKHDSLLLTTSTEDTQNAIDDGTIGRSCLGMIEEFFKKINREKLKIKVNKIIDLPDANKKFKGHKIESVCIESEKNRSMKLHLAADNDTGVSYLFKVRLKY